VTAQQQQQQLDYTGRSLSDERWQAAASYGGTEA